MEHVRAARSSSSSPRRRRWTPGRAIGLVEQILRAARFAHRRGIIHRDLKPHNVIVDDEDRAKVTDFGIARAGASDMTQTGSIMGTAQYLSPEQAQGAPVDARSDLYSIGITLYELLTGRVPFDGDSAVTIALKQVNEAPVPPSAYNAAVTPELDAVVLRALAKDPADRFPDADAFTAALEDARRAPAGDGGHGARAGGLDPTGPAPPAPTGPFPAVAEDPEPDRSRWWLWVLGILLVVAAHRRRAAAHEQGPEGRAERRRGRPGVGGDDAARGRLPGRQRHPDVAKTKGIVWARTRRAARRPTRAPR